MIYPAAMLYTPALNKYLIVLIPAAMLLYGTSHPVNRLRADMPAHFVDAPADVAPERWAAEAEVAQAYWNVAVDRVQWQYQLGSALPADPPESFRIDEKLFGAKADSRSRYWSQLRKAWSSPNSWRTVREWQTSWLTRPASKLERWLSDYVDSLTRS